jgi:adenine-specific DNA-methyltransferase
MTTPAMFMWDKVHLLKKVEIKKKLNKLKIYFRLMAKKDYSGWAKSELVKELEKKDKLLKKKYGVVWEDKPEQVALLCKEKLPVLVEDEGKEIVIDKEKPINFLIEGDNYHALSVLNYTHKGEIDVIYIDPPYNRGNEGFRYNDKIVDEEDPYRHSKWLSFMAKRLSLAKNVLRRTGLIFISIDENEFAQLKLLCDEIFGEKNFAACITWRQLHTVKNSAKYFSKNTEYLLVYAKSLASIDKLRQPADKSESYTYDDKDGKGPYKLDPLSARNKNIEYEFYFDKWRLKWRAPKGSYPRYSQATLKKMYEVGEIIYKKGWKEPKAKRYLSRVQEGVPPSTFWDGSEVGFNATATGELASLLSRDAFLSPKPTGLIKRCVEIGTIKNKESIVLDFFAGSGTTGHAVIDLNKGDKGNRKFILCTNNENNICTNVCYPRIKKVIKNLEKESKGKLVNKVGALKYFKTDFVDAEPTDRNKKKLVDKSTEMLCLKEECFDEIKEGQDFKIFKNSQDKHLGIIYDDEGIEPFKKEVKKINKKFVVYVFSLDENAREEEFEDMNGLVELRPIPAVILNVYKRIFK